MQYKIFYTWCLLFYCTTTLKAQSDDWQVSPLISNNMVIQQEKPFVIWGNAPTGSTISVSVSWNKKIFTAHADDSNEWDVAIPVPKAIPGKFDPQTITVKHGSEEKIISNILIGELWLCSGQSNMDMELKPFFPWLRGVVDYEKEIATADYPTIRLFDVRKDFASTPQSNTKGEWKICSPQTVGDFSAVAYFFARRVFNTIHIPVGLVVPSMGGSSCEAWTSRKALTDDSILNKKYLLPFDEEHTGELFDSTINFSKIFYPTLLYNAMIYPLKNLSLKGFLWYQGESNKDDYDLYPKLNATMIDCWRNTFSQGNLPFYFVQLASYFYNEVDTLSDVLAHFREAQTKILSVENTGMISTIDIGDADDIHPMQKKEVGERLAALALSKTYLQKNQPYSGPIYDTFFIENNTIKICFKKGALNDGLKTTQGAMPTNFFIAGSNMQFVRATARIENNFVYVSNEKIIEPIAVRYAFTNSAVTNLYSGAGLPVWPFRTDQWISPLDTVSYTIEEDTSFSNLFLRDHDWLGADGIFVIPFHGVDTVGPNDTSQDRLIIFSDTILGDIVDNKPEAGTVMPHNTVAILKGREPFEENIQFYWNQSAGKRMGRNEGSMFVPKTPGMDTSYYYWLGDGFVNHAKNNDIYLSGVRVRDTGDVFAFGFQESGNAFIILPNGSKPPFDLQRQIETPLFLPAPAGQDASAYGSFGGAFYDNTKEAGAPNPDGYVYVYGVRGKTKNLMIARVQPKDFEDFSLWRYWDGSNWNPDINKVADVTSRLSNEMSISPLPDGRYALIFQVDGLGPYVGMRLSHTPYGPFGPIIRLYKVGKDVLKGPLYFPYNAKGHPALSQTGELRISYNVNSFNFWGGDIQHDGHLYRPRFLKLKWYK